MRALRDRVATYSECQEGSSACWRVLRLIAQSDHVQQGERIDRCRQSRAEPIVEAHDGPPAAVTIKVLGEMHGLCGATEVRIAGKREIVRGDGADGTSAQQVADDKARGNAPFGGVGAMQNLVEQIE